MVQKKIKKTRGVIMAKKQNVLIYCKEYKAECPHFDYKVGTALNQFCLNLECNLCVKDYYSNEEKNEQIRGFSILAHRQKTMMDKIDQQQKMILENFNKQQEMIAEMMRNTGRILI